MHRRMIGHLDDTNVWPVLIQIDDCSRDSSRKMYIALSCTKALGSFSYSVTGVPPSTAISEAQLGTSE
jgi:hypothetical protein